MKAKRTISILIAVLLAVLLSACQNNSVWGNEKLLVVSKAQGTVRTSADGVFTLTAPDTFRDVTDTDETAAMILTDDVLTVRVDAHPYVLNLATTSAESTTASYQELGVTFVSYTRGQVLGANGVKAVGNYEENGVAMQQCQYSLNQNGHCFILTAYYPLDQARAMKTQISSILGSFTSTES